VRAELLDVDAQAWASFLRESRHDFYHLPAYARLSAAQAAAGARALFVEDGDRAMLLPILVRPIPGGGLDAVSPYGYPGPLLRQPDDPAFVGEALLAGAAMLADEGIVSLFIRMHPLINASPPSGVGTVVRHGDTVSVDLLLPPAEVWRQTRRGHRLDIVKAGRAGRVARIDESWTRFDAFKRLYRQTMVRVGASTSYDFDDAYFDGLRTALGDRISLCVVEAGDTVAAAGLFVETSGIVQFHLSGSDPDFRHEAPSKLMIDYVRAWAKERGNRSLHLGGGLGAADDSLFQFKAGFSDLRHPFHTVRIVCDEARYAELVLARDPSADPARHDGYFPQYRAA
jgi:CelD/BcsL family acetyltransferase involved in cellulose biosynthesis